MLLMESAEERIVGCFHTQIVRKLTLENIVAVRHAKQMSTPGLINKSAFSALNP